MRERGGAVFLERENEGALMGLEANGKREEGEGVFMEGGRATLTGH